MKVLMVSLDYLPTPGGITAHVHELSRALVKAGCDVSIATKFVDAGQPAFELSREGIKIYRFALRFVGFAYGWQINRFIARLHEKERFDLIHIHGMRPLEFYDIGPVALVYTNHTSGYLKRIRKGGYRIAQLKRLFAKPKLFLAPSRELLEIPFEIPAKKVYIPNGVIASEFARDESVRRKLRDALGFDDTAIVGIVTRRMVAKNGVRYLAEAMRYITDKRLRLLLIGDGGEYDTIKAILDRYFAKRYVMLGAKTHKEIKAYYSAADISILPSLMEATSISGLEAMAASLPLVGTRVGGIPELIKEGENGFLCNPADAKDLAENIDRLLKSDRVKMGETSYRIVKEKFDWHHIARRTIEAYRGVM